jgi:hypothetical protein
VPCAITAAPSPSLPPIVVVNRMPQKQASLSARNFLRRVKHSIPGKSKETKDGEPQDGAVVASPVVLATPLESAAGGFYDGHRCLSSC